MTRAQIRRGWQAHFRGERPLRSQNARPGIDRTDARTFVQPIVQSQTPGAILVHIEELVLRGLQRADGDRIAPAFRSELLATLTAKGLSPNWRNSRSFESAETVPARVTSRANAQWIGIQIAKALYNVREERRK